MWRDRNHPSLVIYNLRNEPGRDPDSTVFSDMALFHSIDETRFMTWASNYYPRDFHGGHAPMDSCLSKLYVEPYNRQFLYQGWWDEHHAGGPGCYRDDDYQSPEAYYGRTTHLNEIIFYGEEGAIGTPGRFEKMASEIRARGEKRWDGDDYLDLFDVYDRFLDRFKFRRAFPTVDDLTVSMGNVAYYYQGRIIENVRINNIADGYAVNGWEENKIEDHSGIVDAYRNPKGNPELIARYNRPLYLAVKARKKVLASGDTTVVDVFIVNEENINGSFELEVQAENGEKNIFDKNYPVKVTGGSTYGELLRAGILLPVTGTGYTTVRAVLKNANHSGITTGEERIFSVDPCPGPSDLHISVFDSSDFIGHCLTSLGFKNLHDFTGYGSPADQILIVGMATMPEQYGVRQELLDWVGRGNTMIILGNAPAWMDYLARKEVADYKGARELGTVWYGGNHFVRAHPFSNGLPVNTAFNWEYQCFATYNRHRIGLRVNNGEIIVGAVSDHQKEVYSALGVISHGQGKIVYSSLDFQGALGCDRDISSVAKRLLYNMITEGKGK